MQWRTTKRIAERPENILLDTHCATIESSEDILEHKLIIRAYAAAFSARSGCLLRIIQNNSGEFEQAAEEFIETLRFIGVEPVRPPGDPRPPAVPLSALTGP
jgi:adenylate kinase